MTHRIPDQLLAGCSESITRRYGLYFPKKRWKDLERGIAGTTADLCVSDMESFIKRLIAAQLTKEESEALICRLTVGETYFFREKKTFDLLQAHILPPLIDTRRKEEKRLRIWCAGCSTGEEPYSVAILLHRMLADLAKWNITILASDINPSALRKAAEGKYGDWSFRDTPRWVKERYFEANGEGNLVISGAMKKMVSFAPLNLAQDPFPSLANNTNAMDIIFCRNVMMYFAPDRIKEVIAKLHRCLLSGGWLIVSPCETSHTLFTGFSAVRFKDAILYRKEGDHREAAVPLHDSADFARIASTIGADAQNSLLTKGAAGRHAGAGSVKSPPAPVYQGGAATLQGVEEPAIPPYEEALALYRKGEYAEAAALLSGSLAKGEYDPASPPFAEAAILLAQAFANQGDLTAALEWSENGIDADRLNPLGHYLQATIFQERGDHDAAAVSLKKAIYLDQGFVIAHFSLANLALRQGKTKEAARHLDNAASLLQAYGDDDVLPGSEGLSARSLARIIAATRENLK